jgi:riboflavin biosynthesis pyrimidine reductase
MRDLLAPGAPELDDAGLARVFAFPAGLTRPWLRAVMVSTVDGAGIGPDGHSASVSGPPDRPVFTLGRSLADAVVVGRRTVTVEGYRPWQVPARWAGYRQPEQAGAPVFVVVSARLAFDAASPLITAGRGRTLVVTTAGAPAAAREQLAQHAEVVVAGEQVVGIPSLLAVLAERGLYRVVCEGGPTLLAQIVAAGALDELSLTFTPRLVGGLMPRVLHGEVLAVPAELRLVRLLEESGYLVAGYRVADHPVSGDLMPRHRPEV